MSSGIGNFASLPALVQGFRHPGPFLVLLAAAMAAAAIAHHSAEFPF